MNNSLGVWLGLFLAGTLVLPRRGKTSLGSAGVALRLRRNRARSLPPRPARNQAKPYALRCCPSKSSMRALTLIELIIVIIIVGVLAALGINQYGKMVEKARGAEARMILGQMRALVYQYRLENGSVTSIAYPDVNIGTASDQIPSYSASCRSTHYFAYAMGVTNPQVRLWAMRCTSGGGRPRTIVG